VSDDALALAPTKLSDAGLYADIAADTLADGVVAFTPNFPLWADGADKSRWIALPPGGVIDAADPDAWRFPEGTRVFKEFALDGVRLETRMVEKTGPDDGDWVAVAYRWDADGADATALPEGIDDVDGTAHDIPTAEQCVACHGGRRSFVLGFSAVQLAGAAPYSLEQLVADGSISPAPGAISQPSDTDAQALGYLHANCSHCHNPEREGIGPDCYTPGGEVNFTLPATELASVDDAPALQTAQDKLSPGKPDESEVIRRISHRADSLFPSSMPPLGTEDVDTEAVERLRAWIAGM
jgi:hypothetical protein